MYIVIILHNYRLNAGHVAIQYGCTEVAERRVLQLHPRKH